MHRQPKTQDNSGQAVSALSFRSARFLIALCAREHSFAEAHRKAGLRETALKHQHRAARLTRCALLAEARIADMFAEAR